MAYQDIFTALADPTRRSVLETLRQQPLTVREIADRQTVSRPAVSQHLKVLESANLVTVTPQGNRRFYSIKKEGLTELKNYLNSFWSDVLTAYSVELSKEIKLKNKRRK